jgi:hypothetical protein
MFPLSGEVALSQKRETLLIAMLIEKTSIDPLDFELRNFETTAIWLLMSHIHS